MSKDTAMFAVQRGGIDYSVSGADIKGKCEEGDIFYVMRGDTVYHWKRSLYDQVWEEQEYWFHVKNLTEELFVWPRDEEDHNIWNLTTEQPVERMLPGNEYIIGGYNDKNHQIRFEGNTGNWDFGGKTDVSLLTEGHRMFADCPNFNGDVSPLAPSKWKNFDEMFLNCSSFNQDISDWDVTHVWNNFEMFDMFKNASKFDQNLSTWCMQRDPGVDWRVQLTPDEWLIGCPLYSQTGKHPRWRCQTYNRGSYDGGEYCA